MVMETVMQMLQSAWFWIINLLNRLIPDYILPNFQLIIQIVILLVVGYIVGRVVKIIVVKLMGIVGLKRITTRTWAESVLKATGYRGSIVELIGDLVKWLVYILFLAVIIQMVGLPGVADLFTQIAIFMPRFIGAILIMVIGFIIADFFGKVFEEAGKRFLDEETMARLAGGLIKYSLALIALIMALSLVGLDTVSLVIMFTLILGTVILIFVLGIKDIFPNFAAGIHLRKALKPGEKVRIGEHSGTVEKVSTLDVVLVNKHLRITIPNSIVASSTIERHPKK
jgi:hypothetical protein